MKLHLTNAGELIYCPFHRTWEVYIGEDPALCDWCCQFVPCSMHDTDGGIVGKDAVDRWDSFAVEFDSAREELAKERASRGEVREWVDISEL